MKEIQRSISAYEEPRWEDKGGDKWEVFEESRAVFQRQGEIAFQTKEKGSTSSWPTDTPVLLDLWARLRVEDDSGRSKGYVT